MPHGLLSLSNGGSLVISGTANSVAIFDQDGELKASDTITTTELDYLDGLSGPLSVSLTTLQNNINAIT